MSGYPQRPGWKGDAETGRDAALKAAAKAPTLEARCLELLEGGPATPEELFERIRQDGIKTVLTSVRPRLSAAKARGLVCDSGLRGKAEGGCKAIKWRLTTAEERAIFAAREALNDR